MADPVLDEDYIITLLKCPATTETVHRMQQAAVQAMIDIYDRKATRESFIEMMAPCLTLYGTASKLWIMGNIKETDAHGELDTARIDRAIEQLKDIVRTSAMGVEEVVLRLKKCPTSQDKVH